MNIMLIVGIVAVVALILVIASKTLNIIVGLLGLIAGGFAYFWFGTPDSWMTQLKIAVDFGISPYDLKNYSLVLAVIGLVLLIVGLVRGGRQQKVIIVQQQAPVEKEKIVKTKKEKSKEESKVEEIKAEEPKTEPNAIKTEEANNDSKEEVKTEESNNEIKLEENK